jgi:hypothetical protein
MLLCETCQLEHLLRKEFDKLLKLHFLVIVSKNEEMTDMLQAYFEHKKSARAAICLYHQRYPNRAVPYHKKIDSETNLRIYGVFKKPKQQYPVPRDENVELDVILSIEENPDTSSNGV